MTTRIISLAGEKPPSWNLFYSGLHWRVRHAEAQRVHDLVGWNVIEQLGRPDEPLSKQVDIEVVYRYASKPLDSDNIPAKLYVDGLRHIGLLREDTPDCVRWVSSMSEAANGREAGVFIEIKDVRE